MAFSILYVTSFAWDMFDATGRALISSFQASGSPGRMLCFAEGFDAAAEENVSFRRMDDDPLLTQWLQNNLDIIPTHLGGLHPGCTCVNGPFPPHHKKHKQPCVGHWFNRNTSRWFRKVVALTRALDHPADIIVWLDSDCRFLRKFGAEQVAKIFKGKAVFYMQSKKRPVMEAGVLGFFLERGGRSFIQKTMDRYQSGEFRKYPRWDDSYQWQMTRDLNRGISTIDIAVTASGHADVIQHSALAPYLDHAKGTHSRGIGIMK